MEKSMILRRFETNEKNFFIPNDDMFIEIKLYKLKARYFQLFTKNMHYPN